MIAPLDQDRMSFVISALVSIVLDKSSHDEDRIVAAKLLFKMGVLS